MSQHVDSAQSSRCFSGFVPPLHGAVDESVSSLVTSLCRSVPQILIYYVFIFTQLKILSIFPCDIFFDPVVP